MVKKGSFVVAVLVAGLAAAYAEARPLFPEPFIPVEGDPSGVAVADYNNDGHVDLVVATPGSDSIRLYLGGDDGSFEPSTVLAQAGSPQSPVAEDFNGDGNTDLAVSILGSIAIRFGNGDGTFSPATNYGQGSNSSTIARGDFNGDGLTDLLASKLVLLANGDGTFAWNAILPDWNSFGVGVADLDGDGFDDFVCPGDTTLISFQRSLGNGLFEEVSTYWPNGAPGAVALRDVNGDAWPDLVVAKSPSGVSVLLKNGVAADSFAPAQTYPHGEGISSVSINDLDDDGHLDLITGGPLVSVLFGLGDGQFSAAVTADATGASGSRLTIADLDGDGAQDLVRTVSSADGFEWLFGDGQGGFVTNRAEVAGNQPAEIAVGDLNGDQRVDLAVVNKVSDDVSVLLANGAGTFSPQQRFCVVDAVSPCPEAAPSALALGDLTGDGNLDIAVCNAGLGTVSVLEGDGAGGFSFASTANVGHGAQPTAIALGDLDGDDFLDIAVASDYDLRIFLGNGDGTFNDTQVVTPVGLGPTNVVLGRLDGDDDLDAVIPNYGSGTVSIALGNGDGTFGPVVSFSEGSNVLDAALADVNDDAILDLVNTVDTGQIHVRLGNGDGSFGTSTSLGPAPGRLVVSDFDGDGWQDLGTGGPHSLSVFPGNGDGSFDPPTRYVTSLNNSGTPSTVAYPVVGDFNLDSRPDIAVGRVAVLLNQSGPRQLTFHADRVTLEWPAVIGALTYDLYRGELSSLVDADDDGLADDGYGTCWTANDDDARDTYFVDPEIPGAGEGFLYLMSTLTAAGDSGLGTSSSGLERAPTVACP